MARSTGELLSQMTARLQRTEEKHAEDRTTIAALGSVTKGLEQNMLGSQQELFTRRDAQTTRYYGHCVYGHCV